MTNLASTPPDDNNDAQNESDSNGEQKPEELNIDDPKPGSSSEGDSNPDSKAVGASGGELVKQSGDSAPASPTSEDRFIRLNDITKVEFDLNLPGKGPMKDFVKMANEEAGLPKGHAWALWIYATLAYCGQNIFYDDGCVERRVTPSFVLAGDDEPGLIRRIAVEALRGVGGIQVVTSPDALLLEERLQGFSEDTWHAVVDTGDENIFRRWHKKTSKQEISLAQLFSSDVLNDYLFANIRAEALPPVGVPLLLHCELTDILGDRKFPFAVFRDSLVVPSFRSSKQRTCSKEKMEKLLDTLRDSLVAFPAEIFISLTPDAKQVLDAQLEGYSNRVLGLGKEGNHTHYRLSGAKRHIISLAAAYAVNAKGALFDGKLNKSYMQAALEVFDLLDHRWVRADDLYEKACRADEVENTYEMIMQRFYNYREDGSGDLIVPFTELTKAFCHHPDRQGQFTSGYLERNVLPELVANQKAKMIPGKGRRDVKWLFYTKNPSSL